MTEYDPAKVKIFWKVSDTEMIDLSQSLIGQPISVGYASELPEYGNPPLWADGLNDGPPDTTYGFDSNQPTQQKEAMQMDQKKTIEFQGHTIPITDIVKVDLFTHPGSCTGFVKVQYIQGIRTIELRTERAGVEWAKTEYERISGAVGFPWGSSPTEAEIDRDYWKGLYEIAYKRVDELSGLLRDCKDDLKHHIALAIPVAFDTYDPGCVTARTSLEVFSDQRRTQ